MRGGGRAGLLGYVVSFLSSQGRRQKYNIAFSLSSEKPNPNHQQHLPVSDARIS